MLTYELKTEYAQRQILSREQRQSLEILECSNFQLHQQLREAYFENPMLEYESNSDNQVFNSWSGFSEKKSQVNYLELLTDQTNGVREAVIEQLNPKIYSAKEWKIFNFMIEALEDTGYLTMDISEIAQRCSCTQGEAEKCLEILQNIEPIGMFQKDLKSSLLYQISKTPYNSKQLEHIILYHLEDISNGEISKITREMKISTSEVKKYMEQLGNLNFYLLKDWQPGKVNYIIPDVIAVLNQDEWEIEMNDKWMGTYVINGYYEKMIGEIEDKELYQYFSLKLKQAKVLIFQIEQRRKTIIQITREILRKQENFFKNNGALNSLDLAEIAEAVEKHPSTVSRAIKNKYLQTQKGSFLLKDFLVRRVRFEKKSKESEDLNMQTQAGAIRIKEEIAKMVETEDKKSPYSDQMIADQLVEKGFTVSRRTIAQYRKEMGIWSSYNRKEK